MNKKEILAKGFRLTMACLPFMFLGPYVLHLGFQFRNYLTIGCGILLMGVAMFLLFKGLKTIMKAFF
ncbi:MAG: hypothetical protein HRT68_04960 [Flavobacteriaceae bacterium]|nr:hypothetical protein [Flavobacteriaceae bacterium]